MTCEICDYYFPELDDEKNEVKTFGICRYYPPTIHIPHNVPVTLWPKVNESDWCGRFVEIMDIMTYEDLRQMQEN